MPRPAGAMSLRRQTLLSVQFTLRRLSDPADIFSLPTLYYSSWYKLLWTLTLVSSYFICKKLNCRRDTARLPVSCEIRIRCRSRSLEIGLVPMNIGRIQVPVRVNSILTISYGLWDRPITAYLCASQLFNIAFLFNVLYEEDSKKLLCSRFGARMN